MKILVRFKGDNDFGHVMKAFGNLLLIRVQATPTLLTPTMIADWFNVIAYTLYEITNGREVSVSREARVRLEKYLRIFPEDVYIGVDADKKMTTAEQWANYDSVMVDGSEHAREKVYLV
jgi:hypothetical protein